MSSNTNIGNTPVNQGYVQLIHTGETGGIDGTLRTLYDGDGTASDLQIASNKVKISTQLYIGSDTLQEYIQDTVGAMLVTNASHTNLSAAYDDAGDGAIDLTASGDVTLSNSVTLSNKTLAAPTLTGTTQGASITLSGDLTVNGTTTTVNQTNLDVSDNIIGLNRGAGSNANDSGLIIERGSTGDNAAIIWDESADKFTLGTTTSTPSATGDLTISTGTLVANVEGNVSGNLTTDSVTISTIQTGSESFADNDTSLMTSAAIQDKITSYGYVTSSGISFDGSTANGVLTFKDSDEATVEANLTFDGTDLSVAAGGKISVDEVEGKSNNTNTLLLNDDQTAATNMVTLQSINHINIMTDGNNNGTGNFAVYNGSYDVDTADLAFRITSTGLARFENDIDIPATDRLYLDGRGNTYITESSGDTMKLVAGGQDMLVLEEDSTDYVRIPDNVRLSVGTGNDLQLSHNATNSYIQNYTGDLYFQNHTTDGDIHFLVDDGGGNDITAIQIDASEVGQVKLPNDYQRLIIGDGNDLQITHNGTNTYMENYTGDLYIDNYADDKDIVFRSDDGSGGVTSYLTLDGSASSIEIAKKMQFPASHSADKIVMYSGGNEKIGTEANTLLFTADNYKFKDTNGDVNLFMNNSGNVGIGTTSPDCQLHIHDNSAGSFTASNSQLLVENNTTVRLTLLSPAANGCKIEFGDINDQDVGMINYDHSNNYMAFTTNASERMRIDSSGNVGIGTTSPSTNTLQFGSAGDTIGVDLSSGGTTRIAEIEFYNGSDGSMKFKTDNASTGGIEFWTEGSQRMEVQRDGNIGIGTSSPANLFTVNSTSSNQVSIQYDASTRLRISVAGSGATTFTTDNSAACGFTGDVIAFASSDEKLKDNLKPIENSLDKVFKLSGYEFDWNDKQETYQGHDVGVIAQEVEKVLPEVVTTRDNGYKAVKYEKIVPLLIEAIKEQQKQIEELKNG